MSPASLRWAGRFTRGWVRVYTTGLPRQAARERRDEIASDLWEHASDAGAGGAGARATAAQIFGRAVVGMPADVAWHVGELKGPQMETAENRTLIFAAVVAVLSIVMGILMLIGLSQGSWSLDDAGGPAIGAFYVFATVAGIAGPLVAVVGVHALRRAQAEGHSLTRSRTVLIVGTLGVALLGAALFWTIIGPLIAIGILWFWAVKISAWRGEPPASR